MSMVLFDRQAHAGLLPLTYTRSVADLRIGILTIREYWQKLSGETVLVDTVEYLASLYPAIEKGVYLFIDATIFPGEALTEKIFALRDNEALADDNGLIACKFDGTAVSIDVDKLKISKVDEPVKRLQHPWQIFQWNAEALRQHFSLVTANRTSVVLSSTNQLIHPENIFAEEGAVVEYALLNAADGPIYIGRDATVMEGSFIRGPFSLGDGAVVKMGSKIYGATTIGPGCVVGGELKNVVMQGYSNKAHDGYLGDSVIGEWCNFGAGTSNSNVKNTASDVKMWNISTKSLVSAGIKCGLVMGDYSRTAINTSINTGTTVGVCCNIFGEGLTPKLLHNFTWGMKGLTRYEFEKALKDIDNWKKFKHQSLSGADAAVLKHIFENFSA